MSDSEDDDIIYSTPTATWRETPAGLIICMQFDFTKHLGLLLQQTTHQKVVVDLVKPHSQAAGLESGDRLLEIEERDVRDQDFRKINEWIQRKKQQVLQQPWASQVQMTFLRPARVTAAQRRLKAKKWGLQSISRDKAPLLKYTPWHRSKPLSRKKRRLRRRLKQQGEAVPESPRELVDLPRVALPFRSHARQHQHYWVKALPGSKHEPDCAHCASTEPPPEQEGASYFEHCVLQGIAPYLNTIGFPEPSPMPTRQSEVEAKRQPTKTKKRLKKKSLAEPALAISPLSPTRSLKPFADPPPSNTATSRLEAMRPAAIGIPRSPHPPVQSREPGALPSQRLLAAVAAEQQSISAPPQTAQQHQRASASHNEPLLQVMVDKINSTTVALSPHGEEQLIQDTRLASHELESKLAHELQSVHSGFREAHTSEAAPEVSVQLGTATVQHISVVSQLLTNASVAVNSLQRKLKRVYDGMRFAFRTAPSAVVSYFRSSHRDLYDHINGTRIPSQARHMETQTEPDGGASLATVEGSRAEADLRSLEDAEIGLSSPAASPHPSPGPVPSVSSESSYSYLEGSFAMSPKQATSTQFSKLTMSPVIKPRRLEAVPADTGEQLQHPSSTRNSRVSMGSGRRLKAVSRSFHQIPGVGRAFPGNDSKPFEMSLRGSPPQPGPQRPLPSNIDTSKRTWRP